VLGAMVKEGSYLKREGSHYRLDVEDDSKQNLDRLLARAVEELQGRGDSIFETLIPLPGSTGVQSVFTSSRPLASAEDSMALFTNARFISTSEADLLANPAESRCRSACPGSAAGRRGCFRIMPRAIESTPEVLELAALLQLKERPLAARVLKRVEERIAGRSSWFATLVRSAYTEVVAVAPSGAAVQAPLNSRRLP